MNDTEQMSKNAFITIVGRANVGKSSLLNCLVGERIAAVSCKPQTTRTKITGVVTRGGTQLVFIDTPGMHKPKNRLSDHMVKTISEAVSDGEIIVLVADCTKKISDSEKDLIKSFKSHGTRAVLAINKIDLLDDKSVLMPLAAEYMSLYSFCDVAMISVKDRDGTDRLTDILSGLAQEGPHFFPDDCITDQPERVIMAEMIREKALLNLSDEVPHGIAVTIERLGERKDRSGEDILDIDAVIYCERDTHKGIVIGKGGAMLKRIASDARAELESFFRIKVNLQCWVKVKEGWRNREGLIRNFGLSD